MTLVRWNPYGSGLSPLSRSFDRLFDFWNDEDLDTALSTRWTPPVEIHDKGNEFELTMDLPGLKKEDIDINVQDNFLTIKGERKREHEVKEDGYHRSERVYGTFSRSFTLPRAVAGNKISASYKDGVLTLLLPKAEEAKPKQISIKAA